MTTTTNHACIIDEVAGLVRKAAKIPPRIPIGADSRLVEDLAIDSLDLVGVILQLQDHFDVAIDEDAVPNLCRVADLAAYLAERGGSNRRGPH
jgi:acyl carrier protein